MHDNKRPTDVTLAEWAILDAAREEARLYDLELSERLAAQWDAEDAAMAKAA